MSIEKVACHPAYIPSKTKHEGRPPRNLAAVGEDKKSISVSCAQAGLAVCIGQGKNNNAAVHRPLWYEKRAALCVIPRHDVRDLSGFAVTCARGKRGKKM